MQGHTFPITKCKQEPVEPGDALEKVLGTGKYIKKCTKDKNSKIRQGRVMFFCTALLFNEIYLSIKFCDDISYSFRGMSRVKFKSVKMNKRQ
jgi:hypothetical protein